MTFRRTWAGVEWHAPMGSGHMENDNNDCPTTELRIAFDRGNDWKYRIALNGRRIEALYLDGRRQVDAPERDWDGEVSD